MKHLNLTVSFNPETQPTVEPAIEALRDLLEGEATPGDTSLTGSEAEDGTRYLSLTVDCQPEQKTVPALLEALADFIFVYHADGEVGGPVYTSW